MKETLLHKDEAEGQTSVHVEEQPKKMPDRQEEGENARWLRLFLFVGINLLIVMAVYGIMTRSAQTKKLQQQANQAVAELAVSVVQPEKAPPTILLDLPGQTQAYTQAAVYAQTTGYVKKWNFDIGSQVREGDILVEIDTPQVDQQLNQAEATLKEAQAALDLSRATYQRDRNLLQTKVISNRNSTPRRAIFAERKEPSIRIRRRFRGCKRWRTSTW